MQLLNLISLIILINYHSAEALPDTNIHIQHYDGPIYESTPKPYCCPVCNSPLKPESIDNTNNICEPALQTVNPETTVYIKYPVAEDTKEENSCGKSSRNCNSNSPTDNTHGRQYTDNISKVSGNYGTMLHTDTKTSTGIHNIPVTCRSPYGNTYTGSGNGNSLATHFGYDTYGTGSYPSVATEPLSSYLPVTASQNSCYQVPMLTYNSDQGEPTLIPQKFMYSLILDGEVGSNQNGYNCKSCY